MPGAMRSSNKACWPRHRATLESLLGVTLPQDLVIYIHEQTPTEMHLVLPMPPEEFGQD